MKKVIDIGVNLLNNQLYKNKEQMIENAKVNGVEKIIGICNNLPDINNYKILKAMYENVYSTVGCHPHNADKFCEDLIKNTKTIRYEAESDQRIVAIGECGLDYDRMYSTKENQLDCFAMQLGIAQDLKLPLYIHERDAFDDVYEFLKEVGLGKQTVIHCFTSNREHLEKYLEIGCYIGITGWVTDQKRGQDLQEAVKHLPLEKLMIETDAPYLYPRGYDIKNVVHGKNGVKVNEPANVIYVAEKIAEIKGISVDEVKEQSYKNTVEFFKI
jgi:TatD DNase family protein